MVDFKFSDTAIVELRKLVEATPTMSDDQAIRLYISGFDFSGPEWGFALDILSEERDSCLEFDGIKVVIDNELLEAVGGIDVSYAEDEEGGGFLIVPLAPDFNAMFSGGGGCSGHDCGSCGGGCSGCPSAGGCGSFECDDDEDEDGANDDGANI